MKPLDVILTRISSHDTGTWGSITVPGATFPTIELPWRDNRRQRSRIPAGTYRTVIRQSPRFGRVYHLTGVDGRTYILTHWGNFAGDVELDYVTHSQGCILIGTRFGQLKNKAGTLQRAVLASRPAFRRFMDLTGGRELSVSIVDPKEAAA